MMEEIYIIRNIDLIVAEVKATSEKEALDKYCNSRSVYDRSTHRAYKKGKYWYEPEWDI